MEDFEKGQKVKIKFNISPTRPVELECALNVSEADRLILEFPHDRAFLKSYIYEGKEIEVLTYTDKGIYCFDSVVIESPMSGDFTIEFPEEKIKVQRREYVRVPIKINMILSKEPTQIKGETINIGGGGLRFLTHMQLKKADLWSFNMRLPRSDDFIEGVGEVLYSNEDGKEFVSVIKFVNINEINRNKIIRACFEEEAHIIKNRINYEKR
ncbi:MAG: PilZ domain-containing protein [bacterium]